jgi:hypothetical protein
MLTKTDFLGNEYGPGDIVIYAQLRDRSINMIKARVVEVKENGNVKVQPLGGSRWKGHHGKGYYVDVRTEERISDPWASEHVEKAGHYVDQYGNEYTSSEYYSLNWEQRRNLNVRSVPTKFKDYVESRTDPVKPVTLTVTENIVKFADGELPTEV